MDCNFIPSNWILYKQCLSVMCFFPYSWFVRRSTITSRVYLNLNKLISRCNNIYTLHIIHLTIFYFYFFNINVRQTKRVFVFNLFLFLFCTVYILSTLDLISSFLLYKPIRYLSLRNDRVIVTSCISIILFRCQQTYYIVTAVSINYWVQITFYRCKGGLILLVVGSWFFSTS